MVIAAPMFIVLPPPRADTTRRRLALSPSFLKHIMSQPVGNREEIIVASAYRLRQINSRAFDACVGPSAAALMATVRSVNPQDSKLLLNPSPNTAVGALVVRGLSPDEEKACEELK